MYGRASIAKRADDLDDVTDAFKSHTEVDDRANTGSRNMLITPSMQAVNGMANALGTAGGMAFGTGTPTQAEIRAMARAVPVLGRYYGVKGAVDWWAEGFPKAEPDMRH